MADLAANYQGIQEFVHATALVLGSRYLKLINFANLL